jgi:RNA polymerase sigma-70 factor (ECF subfamily)
VQQDDRSRPGALALVGDAPSEGLPEAVARDLRRRLAASVARTCPHWLAERSEDIVQNVMTQLVATVRKSRGERTFSQTYLRKAAQGATIDEIRRQVRTANDAGERIEHVPATGAGPERRLASREIARGIRDCLTRLARPRRLAVTLHLQGCSVPEAARNLRWPAKRTENLVYRGLADLRRCLQAKGLRP